MLVDLKISFESIFPFSTPESYLNKKLKECFSFPSTVFSKQSEKISSFNKVLLFFSIK
jgi:hypothetical protein